MRLRGSKGGPWLERGRKGERKAEGGQVKSTPAEQKTEVQTWYFDPQIFLERNIVWLLWYTPTRNLDHNYIIF